MTSPVIEVVKSETGERLSDTEDLSQRGSFDWSLTYKRLDLSAEEERDPLQPYRNPVLSPKGVLAISQSFLWKIGGFDKALLPVGGDNYEMSFKVRKERIVCNTYRYPAALVFSKLHPCTYLNLHQL